MKCSDEQQHENKGAAKVGHAPRAAFPSQCPLWIAEHHRKKEKGTVGAH